MSLGRARVLVFAPAAVLSAVTPLATKLRLASLDETGTVVGDLYAAGTAGALVGSCAGPMWLESLSTSAP